MPSGNKYVYIDIDSLDLIDQIVEKNDCMSLGDLNSYGFSANDAIIVSTLYFAQTFLLAAILPRMTGCW